MGSRGRRSAADLATPRPVREELPVDLDALARQLGDRREVVRYLKRAERIGTAISRASKDGALQWFWTP